MVNKKLISIFVIFIILVSNVNASLFATIGMTGLSFVNPTAATVVSNALCVLGPAGVVSCVAQYAKGKIIGQVYGEALNEIAKVSPETAKTIVTYNQVKGYVDTGVNILQELQVNENGEIEQGKIEFIDKGENIGNLLNKEWNKEDAYADNVYLEFNQEEDYNLITFKDGGRFWVKTDRGKIAYENIKKGGYIKLNRKGIITEADITSNEKGGTYIFGDYEAIKVPANTRINYIDGAIEVESQNEFFNYGSNRINGGENGVVFFVGKDKIICPGCDVNDLKLEGELTLKEDGYLIGKNSIAERNKLILSTSDNEVFFANPNADVSRYDKSWVKITNKFFQAQSVENERINLEFVEGNELFNLDNKDLFKLEIANGDYIDAVSRENNALGLFGGEKIPKVTHRRSENGYTIIKNDRLTFKLDEKLGFDVETYLSRETFDKIQSGKYQSVPFQLSSPSLAKEGKDYELRVGSDDQFAILDENNKDSRVVFNRFELPVSENIEDHKLQTLEQLKAKWAKKGIFIDLTEYNKKFRSENYLEPSPYMVQVVDYWLETHPDAGLNYVTLSDMANAMSGDPSEKYFGMKGVFLGERIFDPYTNEVLFEHEIDRDNLQDPINIITHEYEHVLTNSIDDRDVSKLDHKINLISQGVVFTSEDSNILQESKKYIESKFGKREEFSVEDLNEVAYAFQTDYIVKKPYFEKYQSQYVEDKKYLEDNGLKLFTKKVLEREKQFYKEYNLKFNEKKFLNNFNANSYLETIKETALEVKRDVIIYEEAEKGNKGILEEYKQYINEKVYDSKTDSERYNYLSQVLREKNPPLMDIYNKIVENSINILENNNRYKNEVDNFISTFKDVPNVNTISTDEFNTYVYEGYTEELNKLLNDEDVINKKGGKYSYDYISDVEFYVSLVKDENIRNQLESQYETLQTVVGEEAGVPAFYAFRDYGFSFDSARLNSYDEIPTTYREEPIEFRKFRVQQGTPAQRRVYIQLTQVAFDSGKMGYNEYKQIMGENICKKPNCCDMKCKIYKLGCTGAC